MVGESGVRSWNSSAVRVLVGDPPPVPVPVPMSLLQAGPKPGSDPLMPQDVYVSGCTVAIPKWQAWTKAAKAKLDQMLGQTAEGLAS